MDRDTGLLLIATFELGVAAYIGSPCPICGGVFVNLNDIAQGMFGNVPDIIHKACWPQYEVIVGITTAKAGKQFLVGAEQVSRTVVGSEIPITSTVWRTPDSAHWLERKAYRNQGYSLRRIRDADPH